ncbi:hypothetical protein IEQ34_010873 [Dendrobium chrysotoxum]|uniref:Ubiquitin-like protease family profile domain-containing protein n=1 Tax=Dendrobium chrysotoxum TaxID=161865 RepID=A0AAV7GVV1_DENCH|nr:hypothetical protein IEQ34_010873 [Dendrobium chrysotoxum]
MILYPIQNIRKYVMKLLNICMKTKKEPFEASNDVDCGIFVCKYMEKVIIRKKTDWASFKDWQKYMLKFRVELEYALFLTTKI